MNSLLNGPCRIVAGVKDAGAGAFLAKLLEDAHPGVIAHVFAHRAAAPALENLPVVVRVTDDVDVDAESLLKAFQPDFVLVGASIGWSVEKLLITVAKRMDVPVYAFIDNYMNTWQRFAHESTAQRWVYLPDRIYAISDEMTERLRSHGCPSNLIALTTHPVLNSIAMLSPSVPVSLFKKQLGIEQAEIVLTLVLETGLPSSELWCWDNPENEVEPVIERILKILLDFALVSEAKSPGRAVVLIKHHPSDKKSFAEVLKGYQSSIYRTIFNTDKLALLDASTGVFGIGSMLLFEAAARARPAYCINFKGKGGYPFVDSMTDLRILPSLQALTLVLNQLGALVAREEATTMKRYLDSLCDSKIRKDPHAEL